MSDPPRCALCTANDLDALVERVAAAMWERRRHGTLDDRPWDQAGEQWQHTFRQLADEAITELRALPVAE